MPRRLWVFVRELGWFSLIALASFWILSKVVVLFALKWWFAR